MTMLTFSEDDARTDLAHVLEQARVRGAVRIRRGDGQEFVIRPAAAGDVFDRAADEQDAWLNAVTPLAIVRDNLPCTECGYNLRNLPVDHRCPECGRPVTHSIDSASVADPGLRFNLRRSQIEHLAQGTGYPPDAFLFLIDAIVAYCRHEVRSLPRGPIKLSAAQICTAVRDYAGRYFNDHNEARELLGSWKLCRSEDVGSAMRTLIAAGALAVAGCEAEGAFDNIYTLASLFGP